MPQLTLNLDRDLLATLNATALRTEGASVPDIAIQYLLAGAALDLRLSGETEDPGSQLPAHQLEGILSAIDCATGTIDAWRTDRPAITRLYSFLVWAVGRHLEDVSGFTEKSSQSFVDSLFRYPHVIKTTVLERKAAPPSQPLENSVLAGLQRTRQARRATITEREQAQQQMQQELEFAVGKISRVFDQLYEAGLLLPMPATNAARTAMGLPLASVFNEFVCPPGSSLRLSSNEFILYFSDKTLRVVVNVRQNSNRVYAEYAAGCGNTSYPGYSTPLASFPYQAVVEFIINVLGEYEILPPDDSGLATAATRHTRTRAIVLDG